MIQLVVLLRGINVGKARRVSMADLRALLEEAGFADVRTLLNSGNVVCRAEGGSADVHAGRIESEISRTLGQAVPVVVVTDQDFASIVEENPLPQAEENASRMLVAFVQRPEDLDPVRALAQQSWDPEAFALGRRAAFLWCPDGITGSPLMKAFSRATGDAVTTRNWNTVVRLRAMLDGVRGETD